MVSLSSYFRAYPPRFRLTGWHSRQGMPGVPFRWVGTRRVALPYVSSCPPLKTVRTTFMVYGLAPAVPLRARTKRSFPFRQLHSAFPVDSLRVRWVPLVRSFRRLGAFAMGQMPRVHGFPVRRLLRPIRHFLRHRSFVGVALTYFPPSFASSESFPCSLWRTQSRRGRWRIVNGPIRSLRLPRRGMG